MGSMIQDILKRGIQSGADLNETLIDLGSYELVTAEDAKAVCDTIRHVLTNFDKYSDNSPVLALITFLHDTCSSEAFEVVLQEGALLRDLFDRVYQHKQNPEEILGTLKLLVDLEIPGAVERLAQAARDPEISDSYFWGAILESVDAENNQLNEIIDALKEPLPGGFAGVSFLDLINEVIPTGLIDVHPFDTEAGISRFREWMVSVEPDVFSYAQSATEALPYIKHASRDTLLKAARQHPDDWVRMAAAFSAAKLGDSSGIEELAKFCEDPRYVLDAEELLDRLDARAKIPALTQDPEFRSKAEICSELASLMHYGDYPDNLELVGKKTLQWPPSNEERTFHIYRYEYQYEDEDSSEEGDQSTGFAVSGGEFVNIIDDETQDELSPESKLEDVLAFCCCMELLNIEDERTPNELSVAAGRAILFP